MSLLKENEVETLVIVGLIGAFGLYVLTKPWEDEGFDTITRPDHWSDGSWAPGDKRPQVPLSDNDFNPQNQDQPQEIDPQKDFPIETMDRDDLLKRTKSLLTSNKTITGVEK